MLQSILGVLSSVLDWIKKLVKNVIDALSFSNPVNAVHALLGYALIVTCALMGMNVLLRALVWLVLTVGVVGRDLWTRNEKVTESNVLGSLINSLPMHAGAFMGMVAASVL